VLHRFSHGRITTVPRRARSRRGRSSWKSCARSMSRGRSSREWCRAAWSRRRARVIHMERWFELQPRVGRAAAAWPPRAQDPMGAAALHCQGAEPVGSYTTLAEYELKCDAVRVGTAARGRKARADPGSTGSLLRGQATLAADGSWHRARRIAARDSASPASARLDSQPSGQLSARDMVSPGWAWNPVGDGCRHQSSDGGNWPHTASVGLMAGPARHTCVCSRHEWLPTLWDQ